MNFLSSSIVHKACLNDLEFEILNDPTDLQDKSHLLEHLRVCEDCREVFKVITDSMELSFDRARFEAIHLRILEKVSRKVFEKKIKALVLRHLFLVFSLLALGVSFMDPRHYKQFIVLSVLFGVKWIADGRRPEKHLTVIASEKSGERRLE